MPVVGEIEPERISDYAVGRNDFVNFSIISVSYAQSRIINMYEGNSMY